MLLNKTLIRSTGVVRQQQRTLYQVHLTKEYDPYSRSYKYRDWDYVANTIQSPTLVNGTAILTRYQHFASIGHIKPTTWKRHVNNMKAYNSKITQMDDLVNYVKFVQAYGKNANKW